ncbi:putative amidases related to nicotinamidase [Mycena venus]|uniref:Putative amidases related to nicotinamidase n=1 Tax=Mycena venus TaxID=2733690 RepID=A0A8H6XV45_9AGAR|nr:putative amidases related to nicotinamidase [Mycena venus]
MVVKSFREHVGIVPSTATTKDSILVIIDAQNEYAEGLLAVANLKTTRSVIGELLQRYRAASGAIVHVRHIAPAGAPVFTPDTPLAEIFSELKPQTGEALVEKDFPGAFAETNLQELVEKSGKKKIVLVGYMAHVCVSTTAREAEQRGYDVLLVEDAIGDRDIPGATAEEVTKMTLLELSDVFATVVKSKDIQ